MRLSSGVRYKSLHGVTTQKTSKLLYLIYFTIILTLIHCLFACFINILSYIFNHSCSVNHLNEAHRPLVAAGQHSGNL
jgi:hypothetical protein